eukprot:TRINITY_DN4981_c0_g1_i1.p1 TRINITY_DN4981_c0_g1~~TRINITY_DN4981_c0_g1_i1.p1  ORF type:complete len:280 (-),score=91.02 TRINITY_DN4981_c0_g1_i1:541-1380(-)
MLQMLISAEFNPIRQKLSIEDKSVRLGDLTKNSELLDLSYEMKYPASGDAPTTDEKSSVSNVKSKVTTVLRIFAEKGGLDKLIMGMIARFDQEQSLGEVEDLSDWATWLRVLSAHLKLTGYTDVFINQEICRSLLFKVLVGVETNSTAGVPSTTPSGKGATTPTVPANNLNVTAGGVGSNLPENVLKNPFEPLYSSLFSFFKSSSQPKAKEEALNSGAIDYLLIRLATLCAVDHRKSEHFTTFIKNSKPEKKKNANTPKKRSWTQEGILGQRNWVWNRC